MSEGHISKKYSVRLARLITGMPLVIAAMVVARLQRDHDQHADQIEHHDGQAAVWIGSEVSASSIAIEAGVSSPGHQGW
jgi:hypothetical protein